VVEERGPFKDYVNYYHSSQNVNNSTSLTGQQQPAARYDRFEKEANLREYQRRLLRSIEKRSNKHQYDSISYASSNIVHEPTSIQPEDLLMRKRSLNPNNKTPGKNTGKSPLIEKYQDFTVKCGIVPPEESDLVQSPAADKSNFLHH
jgi:hypothetical protein